MIERIENAVNVISLSELEIFVSCSDLRYKQTDAHGSFESMKVSYIPVAT